MIDTFTKGEDFLYHFLLCSVKRTKIGITELVIKEGDITTEKTEAIVNAANERLLHGGGLAYAIAKKAGEQLVKESKQIGHVPTGSAAVTSAGRLPCKYVIHAVGPVWKGGKNNEASLLSSAVESALKKASSLGLSSISIPAISTGIFGYPLKEAAKVIISAITTFAKQNKGPLQLIQVVLFSRNDYLVFSEAIDEVQGIPESAV